MPDGGPQGLKHVAFIDYIIKSLLYLTVIPMQILICHSTTGWIPLNFIVTLLHRLSAFDRAFCDTCCAEDFVGSSFPHQEYFLFRSLFCVLCRMLESSHDISKQTKCVRQLPSAALIQAIVLENQTWGALIFLLRWTT